ncbi:sensor histidine kinase [Bacillus niameyensis]|uniref:sensor histidine kinase n=1 Tax=Bacillus niameyensis TaxID=1522308 RepID=UPI000782A991|nr:histidine kinase [Bacillus niameyensis]
MVTIKNIIRAFNKLLVYQKMIVIFIIMLSLLYMVSLSLTHLGKKSLEEQYLDSVISKTEFYGDILNNQIFYIRTRQLQLFTDSDIEKLSFLGDQVSGYEEVALMNGINEELNNLNNSSSLIVNNEIVIRSYNRILSFDDIWRRDTGITFNHLKNRVREGGEKGLTVYDGKLYLLAMDKGENIISSIELSKDQLLNDVFHIIEGTNDAGVILVDPSSKYVLTTDSRHQDFIREIIEYVGDENLNNSTYFTIKKNQKEYLVTKSELNYLNMKLYTYIDKNELTENMSNLNKGFLFLTCVLLFISILFSWSINRMIHKPLNKLVSLFRNYQEGLETTPLNVTQEREFSYLYTSFNDMKERLDQSIKDNYQNKLALQRSELKQLQSQINPHFLYNSFYTIYRLSKMKDLDRVSTLSQKLASYYQFITKNSSDDVEFEKEYKHALDYCSIQQIRFSNRISFEASELTDEMKHIIVPRLILQPIIENAFEHALENSYKGILRIKVINENGLLHVVIEDNGSISDEILLDLQQRLSHSEQVGETTGMFNVCNRLKLKYGNESGLFASRSHLGGLKIEMKIWNKVDSANV